MNLQGHNVAGNGKRDGVRTLQERAISSRAARTAEGSEAIPQGSRTQESPKHSTDLTSISFYGKVFSMEWSRYFDTCVTCKQTDSPYMAKGQCRRCYLKAYRESPANQERIADAKRKWHLKQPKLRAKLAREERNFGGQREAVLARDGHRCTRCGTSKSLVVHHKDGNGRGKHDKNNARKNLVTLCRACHAKEHAITGWSRNFDACTECKTTDNPHNAKGLCILCYAKVNYVSKIKPDDMVRTPVKAGESRGNRS